MDFPLLDTDVRVQYSAAKIRDVRHQSFRFLGDARQSSVRHSSSAERWTLTYENLNGSEANRLRDFYENIGPAATFTFVDPWTGALYPLCRFTDAPFLLELIGPASYRVELEIEDAS